MGWGWGDLKLFQPLSATTAGLDGVSVETLNTLVALVEVTC